MQPFLKWAGGKRWLIVTDQLPAVQKYRTYIEPFLGGGAVFFHLQPKKAILSDLNQELTDLYSVMRDYPHELLDVMLQHQKLHTKEYYYAIRDSKPRSKIKRAARTLYLNRTCWNGLYRVNQDGKFNVPMGTKSSVIFPHEDFAQFSACLKSAQILRSDFEAIIDTSIEGDFIFADPPYTAKHNANGFVKYNEDLFSWDDQIRLCAALSRAAKRGVAVVVTNADHASLRELYRDSFEYRQATRASVLAGNPRYRRATTEAIFLANIEPIRATGT